MKKIILIIIGTLLYCSPSFAQSFDYGTTTYADVSNILIVNSTGDQTTLSTYGNLGSNDFIAELAVKNELALDGYTVAYDYNPQNTNPQYANIYNQPLPTGVPLTELQFAGFEGNPRAVQDVYVLTSEYNALSSQGQANSISSLQVNQVTDESNISTLQTTVGNQGVLIGGIQSQVATNTANISTDESNISTLQTGLATTNQQVNTNTTNIATDESNISTLQTGLATTNQQVNTNTTNIASNTSSINTLDNVTRHEEHQILREQGEIVQVGSVANTAYNNTQIEEGQIQNTNQVVAGQQNQINGLNNRVGKLERTQDIVGAQVRLFDSRKWQVNAFLDYTTTRATVQEVGIRFTYKLGKSYEEEQLDELNKKLNKLLGEKDKQDSQSRIETYYTGNGVGIKDKF